MTVRSTRTVTPISSLRARLRPLMPGVAVAALLWLILRRLMGDTFILSGHFPGGLLDKLSSLAIILAILLYGRGALGWLKRRLLWRVRRRLVITYLFIGLTPILLLSLLGLISAFGVSAEAMARIITVQIDLTSQQAGASARALAAEFARRAGGADEGQRRAWLEDRTASLQASLPGARLALWCCGKEAAPLPAWLGGQQEWSGLAYLPPAGERAQEIRSFSVRAVVRDRARGRGPFTVILEVPVDGALLDRLRETTGITLHPIGQEDKIDGRQPPGGASHGGLPYLVLMPATDWSTGERGQQIAFMFDWSWAAALQQVLGGSVAGKFWQYALIIVGLIFLGLELVAVIAAAWMTRSVTGAVHGLHRATDFIRRGDFSHRVEIHSRDQLGELAEAFNDMSAHIESLLEERVKRERLEREVEIAAEVQVRLFPRSLPHLATAEVAGECRAARGVAGDYYDYVGIAPGLVALALGDVSGKGISAALLMSNLQASLRAQAGMLAEAWSVGEGAAVAVGDGRSPGSSGAVADRTQDGAVARMVEMINEQLGRSTDANRFATLFVALYDERRRVLRYTNAGHTPAILVHADGSAERLEKGGTIVGAFEGAAYKEAHALLKPGSVLVIFSDGISEARDPAGVEYGEDRLLRFALEHRGSPAKEMLCALFGEVDSWTGARQREDDQTLVILKTHGLTG